MSSNDFSLSTQFEINKIEIDGNDVIGLFQKISLFENLYSPVITGSIVLLDSDGADFINEKQIEGNEDISFEFTNANGDSLIFDGVLNGLRNKAVDLNRSIFTFDFTSEQVRKNEEKFVVKRFKNKTPRDIVSEMIKELGGKEDKVNGSGLPMQFTGSRRRPTEIIKYVLSHGVTQKSSATDKQDNVNEEAKGTTGFLCWQTVDGYRFAAIDEILAGSTGTSQGEYTYRIQNKSLPMKDAMTSIIEYDFKVIGDIQSKMRAGAFKSINLSFDMDKGLYKEYKYEDDSNLTEKQKEIIKLPTRITWRPFMNEIHENSCQRAKPNSGDQSRQYLSQNIVRQNTFADQFGNFTLPPSFKFRAGDVFQVKIPQVESEKSKGYNDKHTGRYIVKQVGHHMFNDGRAYTKVQTVRSTIQQDDASSQKS
ncbi:hypothetical protein [Synechococcus phage S-B68]|nr:hypothetical protein [Synechococcus phage S-B68]